MESLLFLTGGVIAFLDGLERQHFAHSPLKNFYKVANSFEELVGLIK